MRVLGPDHPDTLTTRDVIEHLTEALRAKTQHPDDTTEADEPRKTRPLTKQQSAGS